MKISVVPAQITTVEDKIAGNLTFIQIVLLIIPLVLGTLVYVVVPPGSHLSVLKLSIICLIFAVFGLLALRVKGRTIADWLIILLRYNLRPRIYIFTKNDPTTRCLIIEEKLVEKKVSKKSESQKKITKRTKSEVDSGLASKILENPALMVRFELSKKGGIDVSYTTEQD